jgi:TolA-binding protein
MAAGRPAEAETAFAAIASQAGDGMYAPLARLGQAEAMFAAGKTDEALKIYTDLSAARDGSLPVDGLLMQLGRVSLKAGKTSEARAAFKRVVDEFPESNYITDAREQLAATN